MRTWTSADALEGLALIMGGVFGMVLVSVYIILPWMGVTL